MCDRNLLLIVAVLLPPTALDVLGHVVDERMVETPYGTVGPLALRTQGSGVATWVQPYTGAPNRTDPRATIDAARHLGVDAIFHWDAAISLDPALPRGQAAIVADYMDGTHRHAISFHAHGSLSSATAVDAVDARLKRILMQTLPNAPEVIYLGIDGLRRETAAEARMYRTWGADVLGQNMVPEISLAAEVSLPFAGLVTVVDNGAHDRPSEPGMVRHGLADTVSALPRLLQQFASVG